MSLQSLPAFAVVGITARTTNAAEMSGGGVIPRQWDRFVKEGLGAAIPNRADDRILAVYTDYESDDKGEYTFLIGAKVSSDAGIPEGMVARQVPTARYSVSATDRGPVWQVVPHAWQRILQNPPTEGRAFRADFEVYDERAADPANAVVEIWIGLRG